MRQAERGVIEGEPGRLSVPKLHCKGCGRPVPKGRRNWCGEACIEEMRIRNWPGHARGRVLGRDRGVCAACGRDCVALEARVHRYTTVWREGIGREEEISRWSRQRRLEGWFRRFGLPALHNSLWQADHIVPVVLGGGGCGLDNLRTLCVPCHKRATRELARRRARRATEAAT
jgi:5-methylcytosine-specific restriction endonuclease McrA